MLHTQPVPRSMMAQQFAEAGLKIGTDIAGMLGPFVLIGERGDQQRSVWDLVQLRARRGQWRNASLWCWRNTGMDPTLSGIRRAISSSRSRRSGPAEL